MILNAIVDAFECGLAKFREVKKYGMVKDIRNGCDYE